MTILAIDYGTKKSGIAISIENIAIPLKIVEAHNLIQEIKKISTEKNIKKIIVGYAKNINGSCSIHSNRTEKFVNILKNHLPNVQIIFHDERFSSFEAFSSIQKTKKDKNIKIDDIAASIILQSYIDSQK